MEINIFIAEDDEHIGNTMKAFLLDAGYQVELCNHGETAHQRLMEKKFHLVILDIMLPGMDGYGILKEYRRQDDAPVMMITALSGDGAQIRSFDQLADDFIAKPFSMQILLKRVEALLRRSGALQKEIQYGPLRLNRESFKAFWDQRELSLTLKEFEIISFLAANQERVISLESLINRVWGFDYYSSEATVHTHIKNLRSKLPQNIIKTVRGVGYTLEKYNEA
ncbi:MAG: response regulator transcription factor [Treponema sp.]|nr:response regulator transcription factor [Treponema sp.]